MKDKLGRDLKKDMIITYANDSGWLALAVVIDLDDTTETLRVLKRGYRGAKEKELVRPHDTIVISPELVATHINNNPIDIPFLYPIFFKR